MDEGGDPASYLRALPLLRWLVKEFLACGLPIDLEPRLLPNLTETVHTVLLKSRVQTWTSGTQTTMLLYQEFSKCGYRTPGSPQDLFRGQDCF
jgi:hypothetical protein